ncbi:MAG TPA: efflux RND transporter periplasmic adaptor subunit [Rhodanobacteraceae bacterium]|nr:efflux RND transporter periplasmic adaptor subunit [Rhodanobacteraceae bacterium]
MIRDTSAQDRMVEVKPTRRRLIWIGAAVALIVLIVLVVPWASRMLSAGASVDASRLAFATVERGPFTRDIAAEGRVVAAVRPTLYARSPGVVTLKVHAGDTVKKGQVLAIVDSPELTNQLAQQQSALDGMQVDYKLAKVDARTQRAQLQKDYAEARIDAVSAKSDLARYEAAFKAGAYSKVQVEHQKDLLAKAELTLKNAKQAIVLHGDSLDFGIKAKKLAAERQALLVENLQRQVDDLNVRSPVDGQVGQVFVAPKATVAKNAQLMSVIDLSALQVEVQVPESFARDLGVGMTAQISGNGQTWKGAVSAISPEVVNGQVATRVRFVKAKPEHLRQNQRLSVRILLDHRNSAVTVARGSFVDESGGRYAYVVHDGIAVKTPIQIGATSIDKVEILKGLKPGDKVVISGTDNFNGAQRVVISR